MNIDKEEQLIINKMNEVASQMTFDNYDPFAQKLIQKHNINYNTYEGFYKVMTLCQGAVFVNYYGDIQLRIFKSYLENKYNKILSDEEVVEIAYKTLNLPYNKYLTYTSLQMNWQDRSIMYKDMAILADLYDHEFFYEINTPTLENIMSAFKKFDISGVSNRYSVLTNIKSRAELLKLGLKEFSDNEASKVLKR